MEQLVERIKSLEVEVRRNKITLAKKVEEEFNKLLAEHNGDIDFVDRMGDSIDESDSVWIDMSVLKGDETAWGYVYRVTDGEQGIVFYGYTESGRNCYRYFDDVDGMDLYFLLEFFTEYSKD